MTSVSHMGREIVSLAERLLTTRDLVVLKGLSFVVESVLNGLPMVGNRLDIALVI